MGLLLPDLPRGGRVSLGTRKWFRDHLYHDTDYDDKPRLKNIREDSKRPRRRTDSFDKQGTMEFVPTLCCHHLVDIDPRIMINHGEVSRAPSNETLNAILDEAKARKCRPVELFRNLAHFRPCEYNLDKETEILLQVTEEVNRLRPRAGFRLLEPIEELHSGQS